MRRLAAALAAVTLALSACGGSSEPTTPQPTDPMTAVSEGIREIRSARVEMAIRAVTPGERPVSFEMSGTFAGATDALSLPIADLRYSDRSGVKPIESSFISDGERAWVVNEHGTKEVEGEQLAKLKGGSDVAGLRTLDPSSWFESDPSEQPGESADGEATTAYSGDPDVVAVIDDVSHISANLGAYVATNISEADAERIRAAAQNASLRLVAGKEDNLLRSVVFGVDITGDPKELGAVLRELSANRIEFELTLTGINQPVTPPKTPEGAAV